MLQLQDDRALRRAVNARPRVTRAFQPGDQVAYWRNQKRSQGQVHHEGRWYGALVLRSVGRNLVMAHRKQIFRCAPEQVRPAASKEKTFLQTPQSELLGIKHLIEGCSQFIDLSSQEYPSDPDFDDLRTPPNLVAWSRHLLRRRKRAPMPES